MTSTQQQRVVLVKPGLLTVSSSHFAGGKHVIQCIARTLARNGFDVHVVLASTRSNILVHAETRGLLRDIRVGGPTVSWQQETVTYHAALTDEDLPARESTATSCKGLLDLVGSLTAATKAPILVDADDSQTLLPGSDDACLFGELAYHFHEHMAALVQNVHFLPFGPSGSSPRTPLLLQSWSAIRTVFCVSHFVADYLRQHADIDPARLHVTHLAAFNVYGTGPFPNYGAAAAEQLQQGSGPPPNVGMLKLTPEKGSAIFFEMCLRLPERSFMAVAADPQAWLQAALRGIMNLRLTEPQDDVDPVLREMAVVLVPSIWLEAWGMVVVEAMLRGIPVVVSDAGGLPEACLGAGTVLPVNKIQIPVDQVTGCPDWKRRSYPRQDMDPWVEAVQQLLGSPAAYTEASQRCREAAERHLHEAPQQLAGFVQRLLAPAAAGT